MSAGKVVAALLLFAIIAALIVIGYMAHTNGLNLSIPGFGVQDQGTEVKDHFESKGFGFYGGQAYGGVYSAELDAPVLGEKLLATSIEDVAYVASYAKENLPAVNSVSLDIYFDGYAIYRISGPVDSLAELYGGDESAIDAVHVEDIRPLDFKIRSDLWMFDYLIDVTYVGEEHVSLTLVPYHEETVDMINDLTAIAFIVVQEAPFIDTIYMTVDYKKTSISISLDAQKVLSYMNDEISLEELFTDSGISSL